MIADMIIPLTGRPRHEDLAAAYLAAVAVLLGEPIDPRPTVSRIREDYGAREEERYTYGTEKLGLRAHAVGLMSGHGRHGTRTTWTGCGVALSGESQRHALGSSYARLDLDGEAALAFEAALAAWDLRRSADGAAAAAVDAAVGRWQTGRTWPRSGLITDLREAVASSRAAHPPGATARFLLARLLLMDGAIEAASALLRALEAQGEGLAFCRGIACGLAPDGGLWYVYRPSRTPPPRPHMEVRLALGRAAELSGDVEGAVAHYRGILEMKGTLRGGIRPDQEAKKQLERLGAAGV